MKALPNLGPFGELDVVEWVGTPPAPTMAGLRGRVVAIEAFQMLCPGCVITGLPQMRKLAATFPTDDLVVLGLHTVFEHHEAMGPASLRAFLHEFRLTFPVGIDRPRGLGMPSTMSRLALQGTPSLLLVDKAGNLRANHFGSVDDLALGAVVTQLILEPMSEPADEAAAG